MILFSAPQHKIKFIVSALIKILLSLPKESKHKNHSFKVKLKSHIIFSWSQVGFSRNKNHSINNKSVVIRKSFALLLSMSSRQDFRMIPNSKYCTISHSYLGSRMNPLKLKNLRRSKKNLLDRDIRDILKIKITIDLSRLPPMHQGKINIFKNPSSIKI